MAGDVWRDPELARGPRTPGEKLAVWSTRAAFWAFGIPLVWGFIRNLLGTASWWSLLAVVTAFLCLCGGAFLSVRKWNAAAEVLFGAAHGLLWFHWTYRTKQLADFSFQHAGPVMRWVKAGGEAGVRTLMESMMVLAPVLVLVWLRTGEAATYLHVLAWMRKRS